MLFAIGYHTRVGGVECSTCFLFGVALPVHKLHMSQALLTGYFFEELQKREIAPHTNRGPNMLFLGTNFHNLPPVFRFRLGHFPRVGRNPSDSAV